MSSWIDTIYLFNTIINMFSTTCTILFILYRFTSIFSYIIGFVKFLKRLLFGCLYIKNTISQTIIHNGYIYNQQNDETVTTEPDSFFTKCKKKVSYYLSFLYPKKQEYSTLPIYQTNISLLYENNDRDNNLINYDPITINDNIQSNGGTSVHYNRSDPASIERHILHNQITNLIDDSISEQSYNNNHNYNEFGNNYDNYNYNDDNYNCNQESIPLLDSIQQEPSISSSQINNLLNVSNLFTPTLQTTTQLKYKDTDTVSNSYYSDTDTVANENFINQFKSLNLN